MDPIGYESGDVNLYTALSNNTTNYTDALGLQMGREEAPPPWIVQAGPGVELGRFKFPNANWSETKDFVKKDCKADVTVTVMGFRQFRTYVGDNSCGNFRVYIKVIYKYTNVRCSAPCSPDVVEEDRIFTIASEKMSNHIFLHGEISAYVERFKAKSLEDFEKRFLEGFHNLTPESK